MAEETTFLGMITEESPRKPLTLEQRLRIEIETLRKQVEELSKEREALAKELEELRKKLKEPVILSIREDAKQVELEEKLKKLTAGEAIILGRRKGVL